jgi:hypothetical protein
MTTGNQQRFARDPRGIVGREVGYRFGNVLRLADATKRSTLDILLIKITRGEPAGVRAFGFD